MTEAIVVTLSLFCLAGVSTWYFVSKMTKLINKDNDEGVG